MSGLAEILHNQGYLVKGSDLSDNANVQRLASLGIPVTIGHHADNIRGVQTVVVSSAIHPDNPELRAARQAGLPVITRGEMLAEIIRLKKAVAISGTHGKTTTTSMIAHVLNSAGLDPTVINGGIINQFQTNAKLGNGDWFVVEADESDGSFLKLPSSINVVTNIEPEHMEHFQTEEQLEHEFSLFLRNVPFYGVSIGCTDDARVRKIFQTGIDRRTISYGLEEGAQIKGVNLQLTDKGVRFDTELSINFGLRSSASSLHIKDICLPTFGRHNVLNALAAIAVAYELGLDWEPVKEALSKFSGVKRRFSLLGIKRGVTFIDDYAHHPSEIRAVIEAARQIQPNRVIVVFQAHRYTRFSRFWQEFLKVFCLADIVITMPVYSAGEPVIADISGISFVEELSRRFKSEHLDKQAYFAKDTDEVLQLLVDLAKDKDCVIGMGAGSITDYIRQIYEAYP